MEAQARPPVASLLAAHLTERWGFGLISAVEVQMLADIAVRDHIASPQNLVNLANLIGKGKYPNNCHRDLLSLVRPR